MCDPSFKVYVTYFRRSIYLYILLCEEEGCPELLPFSWNGTVGVEKGQEVREPPELDHLLMSMLNAHEDIHAQVTCHVHAYI